MSADTTHHYHRVPSTRDRSLRAWSSADEYLIRYTSSLIDKQDGIVLFHDRFGYIHDHIKDTPIELVIHLNSQMEAHRINVKAQHEDTIYTPLPDLIERSYSTAIIRVPKSLDLWSLYLSMCAQSISSEGVIYAAFMTRHYTPGMIKIAKQYFAEVKQTRAYKKSRILELRGPLSSLDPTAWIRNILYDEELYQQYLGVFSSDHIDYATQFLLSHLKLRSTERSFLDVGCGNGVIGHQLMQRQSWERAEFMDDSILAIRSAMMNVGTEPHIHYHWTYDLSNVEGRSFDLVITNPPFHFEYEVDPTIAIAMMNDVSQILSHHGRLVIVANKHLNYKSHLTKTYQHIEIVAVNEKFIIYECRI